jgi:ABC-2 type transport system permease protein
MMNAASAAGSDRRSRLVQHVRILRVIAGMDFKLKYADSALGYLWSLAKPVALFLVLYVVFGRFMKLGVGFHGYPLYLLTGIVLWTFFIDATTTTLTSIVARGSLLRRLSFPRLVIPISMTLTSTMTFAVNLIPLVAFIAWNRLTPHLSWLLLVPLLLELYIFTLGVALILATLFVRFRDIGQLWELLGQLLFYATPIIIPVGFLPPWSQPIVFLNPFVQVMQDVRGIVVYTLPSSATISAADRLHSTGGRLDPILVALLTLAVGLYLFRRESPWFAERV